VQDSSAGYIVRHDTSIARDMPGPHDGKGITTGSIFFDDIKTYPISFRKRVLHPGSSIGKHTQGEDEVYYVVSGSGTMYINDQPHIMKPGDAFLTRTGSTHETVQQGSADLVLIIAYEKH
jgi:mannose-6-phosphate isomerase-like protein (cupin superfamily)